VIFQCHPSTSNYLGPYYSLFLYLSRNKLGTNLITPVALSAKHFFPSIQKYLTPLPFRCVRFAQERVPVLLPCSGVRFSSLPFLSTPLTCLLPRSLFGTLFLPFERRRPVVVLVSDLFLWMASRWIHELNTYPTLDCSMCTAAHFVPLPKKLSVSPHRCR